MCVFDSVPLFSMGSFNLILLNNHIHEDQNQKKKKQVSLLISG